MLTHRGPAARLGARRRAAPLGRILLAALLPAVTVLPVHALYQHQGTPGPPAGSPAGVSRTADPNRPPAVPRYAAAILVRFADSLQAAGEVVWRRGPFLSATVDHSDSLDRLFAAQGVRGVHPLFREDLAAGNETAAANRGGGGPGTGAGTAGAGAAPGVDVRELRRRQDRRIEAVRARLPVPARTEPAASFPDLYHVYRLDLDPAVDPEAAAAAFARDPHVVYAEADAVRRIAALPDDTYLDPGHTGAFHQGSLNAIYADLWGLQRLDWQAVWEGQRRIWHGATSQGVGGAGEVVAVVDTGLDFHHPDIVANVWHDAQGHPGRNVVDVDLQPLLKAGLQADPAETYNHPDFNPLDVMGHGTHVSGIIGAVADNGLGIAGVAWNAKVMAVKAGFSMIDQNGYKVGLLTDDNIVTGLQWAADHGASVINMSFGGTQPSQTVAAAVDYARRLGDVLIAAAGNDNSDAAGFYPAGDPGVLCVGATLMNDVRAGFSNYGVRVDLAAPGADILSLRAANTLLGGPGSGVGDDYVRASGTSMAAPQVAGAAALLLSAEPTLTADQVARRLVASADPGPDVILRHGFYSRFGSGRLDVRHALEARAAPAIVLKGYEVTTDPAGVLQPGKRAVIALTLINAGDSTGRLRVALQVTGLGAPYVRLISPQALTGSWPAGAERTLTAGILIGSPVPWGFQGALQLTVRGSGLAQSLTLPLPIVLHGPAPRPGWPVTGAKHPLYSTAAPALHDLFGDGRFDGILCTLSGEVFAVAPDGSTLPGWPLTLGWDDQLAPSVVDLRHDGHPLVVLAQGDEVHVVDPAGRELPGWPQKVAGQGDYVSASAAVGDVTGRGEDAIVVVTYKGVLWAFAADGAPLPGWPKQLQSYSNTPPTLVDLDGDGALDIVAGDITGRLYAWKANGLPPPGTWPSMVGYMAPSAPAVGNVDGTGEVQLAVLNVFGKLMVVDRRGNQRFIAQVPGTFFFSSLALGDVAGLGKPAIVVGSGDAGGWGYLSVFDGGGHMLPGWPVILPGDLFSTPALVDFFGDGKLEIVAADDSGALWVFTHDGRPVGGWPVELPGPAWSPVAADLDASGTMTVVSGTDVPGWASGALPFAFAFDFGDSGPAWPTVRHDPARTSAFSRAAPPP